MSTNLSPDAAVVADVPAVAAPIDIKKALKDNIKRSERDSRIDPKLMLTAILLLVMGGGALYTFFYSGTVMKIVKPVSEGPLAIRLTEEEFAQMQQITPTPTQTRLVLGMGNEMVPINVIESAQTPVPAATPVVFPPLLTPDIAATVIAVLAARDAAAAVVVPPVVEPGVIREYIEIPGETITVTHTITQAVYIGPTATPVMSPGVLRVCLYVEGVTGIYINDVGVPGNECRDYPVGGLVNHFAITVTK